MFQCCWFLGIQICYNKAGQDRPNVNQTNSNKNTCLKTSRGEGSGNFTPHFFFPIWQTWETRNEAAEHCRRPAAAPKHGACGYLAWRKTDPGNDDLTTDSLGMEGEVLGDSTESCSLGGAAGSQTGQVASQGVLCHLVWKLLQVSSHLLCERPHRGWALFKWRDTGAPRWGPCALHIGAPRWGACSALQEDHDKDNGPITQEHHAEDHAPRIWEHHAVDRVGWWSQFVAVLGNVGRCIGMTHPDHHHILPHTQSHCTLAKRNCWPILAVHAQSR